jgi:hypothetical protein
MTPEEIVSKILKLANDPEGWSNRGGREGAIRLVLESSGVVLAADLDAALIRLFEDPWMRTMIERYEKHGVRVLEAQVMEKTAADLLAVFKAHRRTHG